MGWSRSTFYARRSGLVSRECPGRGGNGRPEIEYLASALNGVAALPQLQIVRASGALPDTVPETLPLFLAGAAPVDREALPTEKAAAEADARFAIVGPVLDFAKDPGRFRHLRLRDGSPVTSVERMIRFAAETSGNSVATLKRWLRAYRGSGYAALADRVRSDKGHSRWFDRNPQAALLALYLYLNEQQSISFVWRQLKEQGALVGLDVEDLPSAETVRVFLSQEVSPAMRALAREGAANYRERMAPYLRRGYRDVHANQIWVADHMIHDVEAANDLFEDAEWGAPIRMRLSAMLDYRSRLAVGSSWAWEGSSRSISATLRRAVLMYGPPEVLYMDNGKDYLKVARGARPGRDAWLEESALAPARWWEKELAEIERSGVLARLGVAAQHCLPHHPQSKHVERFFRTVHMQFDARHLTYTSGSPATRPERTEAAMMRHRRLLRNGNVEASEHPLASTIVLGFLSWLNEYNNAPHNGEGMDGRSPLEVFGACLNPNQRPTPQPWELTLLLADMTRRVVDSCAIRLANVRYTPRPEDREAWAQMHEWNEREVLVAYDKGDPETAVALDPEGRPIAWLVRETLLRFAPGDAATQAQVAQSFETRRGLEKAARSTLTLIAQSAQQQGMRGAQATLQSNLSLPEPGLGPAITQRKPRNAAQKNAHAPATASDIANEFLEGLH